jgi:thioredoxin reductase (NADPH)
MIDLLVVGAGPVGLAAAISARRHGMSAVVVEKGVLVNSIYHFPTYMAFFTTPELIEIGGLPLVTPYEKPTRLEALRYYRRVVDATGITVAYGERVEEVEREGDSGFIVTTSPGPGLRRTRGARAVVLAIGYYDIPNRLDVPGEDLPHVAHYYREAHPYYRQRVVIVGGKNSAVEAALDLYRSGAQVTLVHRGAALGDSIKYWVRPDIENRIAAGSIAVRYQCRVVAITPHAVTIERAGETEVLPADSVLLLTGYRPDVDLMRRAGIRCDKETLVPSLDPETFETNVPNLFLAGGCTVGRHTGSIFIENGRFHGDRIAEVLAKRFAD